jgi:crossover junction endodeoxyribonuclease RuvC
MSVVIGCDPGLASWGVALVDLEPQGERVIAVATLATAPSPKKRGILVADDDVRRCRELLVAIDALVTRHRPVALCAELPSGSKGARAAQALGVSKALVASLSHQHGLPLVACSPRELKLAVCGNGSASKDEVRRALDERFPGIAWPRRKADVEHAADALGAVVAGLSSDVIRMARRRVA